MTKAALAKRERPGTLKLDWAQLNTPTIEPGDLVEDYSRWHRGVAVEIYERDLSDDYPGCYVEVRSASGSSMGINIIRCRLIRKWPEVMRMLHCRKILNLRSLRIGIPVSQVCFPKTPVPAQLRVRIGHDRREVMWSTANCIALP